MSIAAPDLDSYFAKRKNNFTNDLGVHFIRNENGIFSYVGIPEASFDEDIHEHTFQIGIQTSGDTAEEFIILFRLEDQAAINTLSYHNSWIRYLNSSAEMIVNILYLKIDVCFLIRHQKTMIFSPELHFYDEVNTHLTLAEDFEKYLIKNRWKLETALERRSRDSRQSLHEANHLRVKH